MNDVLRRLQNDCGYEEEIKSFLLKLGLDRTRGKQPGGAHRSAGDTGALARGNPSHKRQRPRAFRTEEHEEDGGEWEREKGTPVATSSPRRKHMG